MKQKKINYGIMIWLMILSLFIFIHFYDLIIHSNAQEIMSIFDAETIYRLDNFNLTQNEDFKILNERLERNIAIQMDFLIQQWLDKNNLSNDVFDNKVDKDLWSYECSGESELLDVFRDINNDYIKLRFNNITLYYYNDKSVECFNQNYNNMNCLELC